MTAYTWNGSFPSSPSTGDTLLINGTRHEYTAKGSWRKTEPVDQGIETLAATLGKGNTVPTDGKINFRDADLHISSSTDGQLDIVADTEIQIAAPTVDINGAVALDGAITGATNVTLSGNITVGGTVDGRDVAADGTKLDTIEANADVTDVTNVTAAGALMDSELTDLAGVKGVTISTLQVKPSEGAFVDGDKTKLDGIEASADVTDSTNVVAALTAGTGITIEANGTIGASPLAITTVQVAANESAQLALTAQEGDVVVRSDENKSYMHNGGTAGTMDDYTLLATPTDAVLSVNGNTGAITADQIATAVEAATNSNTFTDADHSKLDAIEASADVTDATNVTAAGAAMLTGATFTGDVTLGTNAGAVLTIKSTDASLGLDQQIGRLDFYKTDGSGGGAMTVGEISVKSADASGVGAYMTFDTTTTGGTKATALTLSAVGDATFAGSLSATTGTFTGNVAITKAGDITTSVFDTTTGVAGSTRTLAEHYVQGKSNSGATVNFQNITYNSADATNGSEDGSQIHYQMVNGSSTAWLTVDGINATFAGDVAVDTDTLFVDVSADRVGINTASPVTPLHVNRADDGGIALFRRATTNAQIEMGVTSGDIWINGGNGNGLTLRTNAVDAITLDNSQNATFAGAVSLTGTITQTGTQLDTYPSAGVDYEFVNRNGAGFQFYTNSASVLALDIDATGNATFGGSITTPLLTSTATATRDKIRLWTTSTYAIGMDNAISFGAINNEYAMTFQMNNDNNRGFWWGDEAHSDAQGAMSLSTDGKLTVATGARIGFGESDTTIPSAGLQVNGSVTATSFVGTATSADNIDGIAFTNSGSSSPVSADTIASNGISYYTSGVDNFSGNATDGALYSQVYSSSWQHQIAGDYRSGQIALRGKSNGTWQAWRKVWDVSNDGSGSGLDADLLDGFNSGENGANTVLRLSSYGYANVNNWVQIGSAGIFSSSVNGAHFAPNTTSSYGTWRILGIRGGYSGIYHENGGGVTSSMYDASGNGGEYRQASSRWYTYYNLANSCMGISASVTSSAYSLYVSGAIYATGAITEYSDRRVKENIRTIDNALETVEKMRGVYYNRIDDENKKTEIGFIAQEVDEVKGAKPLVTYAEDVDQYGVSYGNTTALLVEAIKELSQQVKDLQTEIKEMKNA